MNNKSLTAPSFSFAWRIGTRLASVCLLVTGAVGSLGVLAGSDRGPNALADVNEPSAPSADEKREAPAPFLVPAASLEVDGEANSGSAEPLVACPAVLTVLPNTGSYVKTARAPLAISRFERGVYLITAAELAANGLSSGSAISGIGWNYNLAAGVAALFVPLKVYLENTSDTTMRSSTDWATEISTMTFVHSGNFSIGNFFSPIDLTFAGAGTSPFTYGGGGLYVAFDYGRYNGALSTPSPTTVGVLVNTGLTPGGLYGASTSAAPVTLTTSSAERPETRLKVTSSQSSDASVDQVMSMGALPLGVAGPQTIQAVVNNRGALTLTNLQVTLNITGAETFTDTQSVATLDPCGQAIVSFAAFTPTASGSDTVEVSVPADGFAGNNSKSNPLSVTAPRYSYEYPGSVATLGLGGSGGPIAIVGKFAATTATSVSAVNLDFFVPTATTYKVAIYGDDGFGLPGTELYLDVTNRTVAAAGPVTITLSPTVPVGPGNFFVGFQQTNATYAYVSYASEIPIRPDSFFLSGVPPTTWSEFSSGGNNFKVNIGVSLDRCQLTQTAANNGPICEGATLQLQSAVSGGVTFSWTGPNGFTSTQQNPSIPAATPAASGIYTVTVNGCASPATTSASVIAAGAACEDGNPCTAGEVCGAGNCSGGTPITAPPETINVAAAADKSTYTWSAALFATRYDVVRGATNVLPVGPGGGDEVCFDNLPGAALVDPATPVSGTVFWYLSRGENTCGVGTYGTQSSGAPRITSTCP